MASQYRFVQVRNWGFAVEHIVSVKFGKYHDKPTVRIVTDRMTRVQDEGNDEGYWLWGSEAQAFIDWWNDHADVWVVGTPESAGEESLPSVIRALLDALGNVEGLEHDTAVVDAVDALEKMLAGEPSHVQ